MLVALFARSALAACTFGNPLPASGTVAVSAPTFSATTTCTTVGLQVWPTANPANKQVLGPLPGPVLSPTEDLWDTLPAGNWSWRWIGNSASGPGVSTTQTIVIETDVDDDGVTVQGGDCDDADPAVHPGAVEACNTVDDDCDGLIDDQPGGYLDDGGSITSIDAVVNAGAPGSVTSLLVADEDLHLCPGAYFLNINTTGTVTLQGHGDARIEADGGYGIAQGSGGTVRVQDLGIGGGSIGWFCASGGTMIGNRLWIHDNTGNEGAGLYLSDCDGLIVDSDLQRNSASAWGGGIKATYASNLELRNSTVTDGSAANGGGAALFAGSHLTCRDSAFLGNAASTDGAAVYTNGSTLDLIRCDLGSYGAPDDNQGVDIADVTGRAYPAGDAVTNTCNASGVCGTAVWTEPQNLSFVPSAISQHADLLFYPIAPLAELSVEGVSFTVKKTSINDPACTARAFVQDASGGRVFGPTIQVSAVPNQAVVAGFQLAAPDPAGDLWAGLQVDCGVFASSVDVGAGTGMSSLLEPQALYRYGLLTTTL
ncbi:MAG: putative metal-binding motif-containing protein [Alphaproteobacteria bacterium]|nr:putative metal-binding motif-containing protein [Alphaproteobacteria bacterium]